MVEAKYVEQLCSVSIQWLQVLRLNIGYCQLN